MLLAALLFFSFVNGQSHITFTLSNASSTNNTLEYDLFIVNDGTTTIKLAAVQVGVLFDASILNGGTPATTAYAYIPGTTDEGLSHLIAFSKQYASATHQLRLIQTPQEEELCDVLTPNVQYRLGRFRFTNTVDWAPNSMPNLHMQLTVAGGYTVVAATTYIDGSLDPTTLYITGDAPAGNRNCVIDPNSSNIVLNPTQTCNVSGTADNISYDCLTGTGSASISISGDGSDASGTYSLDGGEAVAFSTNPFTITGLTPGAHTVVTTTGECTSSDINFAVNAPAALNATYTVTDRTRCSGSWDGAIALEVTGGSGNYNYSWSGVIGSGNPATTPAPDLGNTPNPTGLQYGFYNVTVTDAEGCGSVAINDIHVQWAFPPIIQTDGSNSASCNASGTIVVYASAAVPPYMYALDEGTPQASNLFTGVSAGEHTVTVTDAGGCETSQSVTVASSPALGLTYYAYPASSCSDDGAVSLFRSGGIPPIEYSIDGGPYVGTGNYFTGLAAGEHSATVRDSKGCTFTTSFTIAQGAGLTVTTRHSDASTCINDGSIQVVVSGGVAPYTYSLDGGAAQGSASFNDLAAGNYVVTVTDARGCTGTANATVSTNYINVTFEKGDAPDCGGTGWIRLYRTGGSGPFTYSLDGNNYAPSNVFTGIAPGTYTGYIKDSKTCVGQTTENAIIIGPADCNQGTRQAKPISEDLASVNAYPNPSMNEFNLQLKGFNMNEKVSITVTDLLGRKVYQTEGIGKRFYQFGNHFFAGMYNVTIIQGKKMFSVKVVKE